jgi:glyoxylate/hydroxypyruvate reductase
MNILFYTPDDKHDIWLPVLRAALPQSTIRLWHEGDNSPADYAIVWKPPAAVLREQHDLKAIFVLGAGVDAMLQLGEALPANVPLIRIDDGGMALQMAQYVSHAVLTYFRWFDVYAKQAQTGEWQQHAPLSSADFGVGIMGLGVLGSRVAKALRALGFPVNAWTRSARSDADLDGVQSYVGEADFSRFLQASRVLVCVLPLTTQTENILNRHTLAQLPRGSYLINIARGAHVVEEDLQELIAEGHIAGATLDVFRQEPLPPTHAFWREPRITITPHISALTLHDEAAVQIAQKIAALENGLAVAGVVDLARGY